MENEIKLYAKTNEVNVVVDIKTKDFAIGEGWVEIGTHNDRMYHEPITNEQDIYLYKIKSGKKVNRTATEIQADVKSKEDAMILAEENAKDITKAEARLKALALVVADLTGKTPKQIKDLVRDKL